MTDSTLSNQSASLQRCNQRAAAKAKPLQPDWWLKSMAGAVLGFLLALACSGLLAWWGPGGIAADNKVQFNMWLIPFLWMPVFSLTYLFRTGWLAVGWLAGLNILAYGLLWLARLTGLPA